LQDGLLIFAKAILPAMVEPCSNPALATYLTNLPTQYYGGMPATNGYLQCGAL
jgi:hypothetical protein